MMADRTVVLPIAIAAILVMGGLRLAFYPMGEGGIANRGRTQDCAYPFACLFAILQFLPLLTVFGWLGGVECKGGLRWELHAGIALIMAAAAPFLMKFTYVHHGKLPLLGWKGIPYVMYLYVVTLLGAFDQYSDAMATAIAFACGFSKAYLMLLVLVTSYCLQALSAWCTGGFLTKSENLIDALVGVSPDGFALDAQKYTNPLASKSCIVEKHSSKAILSISKMFTENLPQATLQILFLREMGALNAFVAFSIGISLLMAFKACCEGFAYFKCCPIAPGGQQAPME